MTSSVTASEPSPKVPVTSQQPGAGKGTSVGWKPRSP